MATNQFLPFGTGAGANVLAPAAYAALAARASGFSAGTAKSQELNSVWRQASFGVAALAQFIADQSGDDVLDDGNLNNFKNSLARAISLLGSNAGFAVDTGSANVYTVAYTPAITSVYDGLRLRFRANVANTGASTFSPNGITAAPIWSKKHAALTGGEIVANGEVELVWNPALNTSGAWVLLENTGGADQLPATSYGTTPAFADSSLLVPTTAYIQQALANLLTKSVAGGVNVTLSVVESRYPMIVFNGALTANINVIMPTTSRQWIVLNNTSGAFTLTVKTAAGTGITVSQGVSNTLYCDGTNVLLAGSTPGDATEVVKGILRIATQVLTDAAVDDGTAVSPLKLAANLRTRIPTAGNFVNLKSNCTGGASTVFVTADQLQVGDSAGNARTLRSVSVSINIATTGANGLDTGTSSASAWYYSYVIFNPTTLAVAGLASLIPTAPSLPSGYTHYVRVGAFRTDATASKFPLAFTQSGRRVQYKVGAGTNITSLPVMASGLNGSTSTPTWVAIAVASFIPPTATCIEFVASTDAGGGGIVAVAPNNQFGAAASLTNPPPLVASSNGGNPWKSKGFLVLESTNIYIASTAQTSLSCIGWEENF